MMQFTLILLKNQRALLRMELQRLDGRIDAKANADRMMLQERIKETDLTAAGIESHP